MTDIQNLVSPVGRLVQGSAWKPNTTDQQGNPLVHKSGPNIGQPRVDYFLGVAFEKNNPDWPAFWAAISSVGQAAWPGGQFNAPSFSWKLVDGDGVDANGQPYATREGFAGCYVIRFSSGFAPNVVSAGGASGITDQTQCKRGDYVRMVCQPKGNNNPTNPGIYMNFNIVEFIGYGEEIKSGPDAAALLGNVPAAHVPAGVSQTPVAPAQTAAPVATAPVAPLATAPVAPAQTAAPLATAPVAPHNTILNQ